MGKGYCSFCERDNVDMIIEFCVECHEFLTSSRASELSTEKIQALRMEGITMNQYLPWEPRKRPVKNEK